MERLQVGSCHHIPTNNNKQGGDETMSLSAKTTHLVGAESSQVQSQEQEQDMTPSLGIREEDNGGGDENDELDILASINRALSSVGLSSLAHLNKDKRRRGNNCECIKQGHERKTRLSWEVHPSLLLHDFIEELEALDNGTHRILDNEEDEESSKQRPESIVIEQEEEGGVS
eukprot:scaffold884_cov154-Skeletonema_menzelii.AAC.7